MHRLIWLDRLQGGRTDASGLDVGSDSSQGGAGRSRVVSERIPQGRDSSRRADRWCSRATWAFVGLGLLVRLVRYLVRYPIWHDEAFLAVNFLDRGYLDLMRPLDYMQVGPILFLWIELSAVRLLGFSEWSLRLFPAICGLASVLLFRHVAARLLRGLALVLAVGIFATAFYPIRHGAEVKPYASDLLSALILLAIAFACWRSPGRCRFWWVLTAVGPILLALSYPAVFVAGGLSLALGPIALRQRRPVRIAYLVYNLVLVASFASLYSACTVVQSTALRSFYRWGYWRDSFTPCDQPWKLPGWLLAVHTGNAMAYPIGGERGASTATLVAFLVGTVVCWRSGRRTPVRLLLAPFGLGLAAAALGQYPYGSAPRITQYLVPSICLFAGLGAAELLTRMSARWWRRHLLKTAIGVLAAIGSALIARDLVQPYRVWSDEASRRFARRFWSAESRDAPLVCAKSDLGIVFQPKLWKTGMSAVYLFHRGMYSQRHVRPKILDRDWVHGDGRPIRLVLFDEVPRDNPLFELWLDRIRASYQIPSIEEFVVSPGKAGELWLRERYVVLTLVSRERGAVVSARPVNHSELVR
jgi:hypothetical protein